MRNSAVCCPVLPLSTAHRSLAWPFCAKPGLGILFLVQQCCAAGLMGSTTDVRLLINNACMYLVTCACVQL